VLVPRLADWCSIDLRDDCLLRNIAVAHADPTKAALARELHVADAERAVRPDMPEVTHREMLCV